MIYKLRKLIMDSVHLLTRMLTNLKREGVVFIFLVSKMDSVGHEFIWSTK